MHVPMAGKEEDKSPGESLHLSQFCYFVSLKLNFAFSCKSFSVSHFGAHRALFPSPSTANKHCCPFYLISFPDYSTHQSYSISAFMRNATYEGLEKQWLCRLGLPLAIRPNFIGHAFIQAHTSARCSTDTRISLSILPPTQNLGQ